MCVWKRYEKYDELIIGIENKEVVKADGERLRKKHAYEEFMELAGQHGWQPTPEPTSRDASVTLKRRKQA